MRSVASCVVSLSALRADQTSQSGRPSFLAQLVARAPNPHFCLTPLSAIAARSSTGTGGHLQGVLAASAVTASVGACVCASSAPVVGHSVAMKVSSVGPSTAPIVDARAIASATVAIRAPSSALCSVRARPFRRCRTRAVRPGASLRWPRLSSDSTGVSVVSRVCTDRHPSVSFARISVSNGYSPLRPCSYCA